MATIGFHLRRPGAFAKSAAPALRKRVQPGRKYRRHPALSRSPGQCFLPWALHHYLAAGWQPVRTQKQKTRKERDMTDATYAHPTVGLCQRHCRRGACYGNGIDLPTEVFLKFRSVKLQDGWDYLSFC